jgi:hypothetical protein
MRIVQQSTMDDLLGQLTRHSQWRKRLPSHLQSAAVAIAHGIICMPIWGKTSACPIWPAKRVPTGLP